MLGDTAYDDGLNEGIEQGIAQGIEQAQAAAQQERLNMVRNFKAMGLSNEQIPQASGLSLDEIARL